MQGDLNKVIVKTSNGEGVEVPFSSKLVITDVLPVLQQYRTVISVLIPSKMPPALESKIIELVNVVHPEALIKDSGEVYIRTFQFKGARKDVPKYWVERGFERVDAEAARYLNIKVRKIEDAIHELGIELGLSRSYMKFSIPRRLKDNKGILKLVGAYAKNSKYV